MSKAFPPAPDDDPLATQALASNVVPQQGPAPETRPPNVPSQEGTVSVPSKLDPSQTLALSLAAGAKIGRYEILRELGRGGMGSVYLAFDTQLERQVALKIPLGVALADDLTRFFREARAAARLRHPHICPVYDVAEADGVVFFTMAYIEGQSLAARARRERFSISEAASIVRTLALAMQEAHAQGVIHRDLKPANVLIDRAGQPIVTDFGLARPLLSADASPLTQDGQLLGTPSYMPPEQIIGETQAIGPWTDQYSLGMILYELLAQRLPFQGSLGMIIAASLQQMPPPLATFRSDVPPALDAVCRRTLEKDPARRFGSMSEFASALLPFTAETAVSSAAEEPTLDATIIPLVGSSATTGPAAKAAPVPKKAKRRGWMVAAVGCLAIVLATYGGIGYLAIYGIQQIGEAITQDYAYLPNWDDTARLWRAPPAEEMPPDFSQLKLPSATLVSQDDAAAIADLHVELPGKHAVYREFGGDQLDVYLYRATPLEREAVYRRVLSVIDPPDRKQGGSDFADDGDPLTYPHYPSRSKRGDYNTIYLDWRYRWASLNPGDAAVFWYDEGWLFAVRTHSKADPRKLLSELLGELNGGVRKRGSEEL